MDSCRLVNQKHNSPHRNGKDDTCQLQLANLVQLREALSAQCIPVHVTNDHTACAHCRTRPQVKRATPGGKNNTRDEYRPDEEINNALQDRMNRPCVQENVECREKVVHKCQDELVKCQHRSQVL